MARNKVILGIDPGTQLLGYGLLKTDNNKMAMITMGVLDLKKYTDQNMKLQRIFEKILSLVDDYHPDELAIEAPFYGKNVQSMLKLGRAQGVAMAAGLYRSLPIFEYSPRKIKQAITGNGNASKEQVAAFLKGILGIKDLIEKLDATDGLATAVCHNLQNPISHEHKVIKSWKEFITKNPGRIEQ